jgi:hypothetical protein
MNFTTLELWLLFLVGVLLFRDVYRDKLFKDALGFAWAYATRADLYADFLILVGKGEGKVECDAAGKWVYKGAHPDRKENPHV